MLVALNCGEDEHEERLNTKYLAEIEKRKKALPDWSSKPINFRRPRPAQRRL